MNRIFKMEEPAPAYDLAGAIIGFAMRVHTQLGPGFLESVYRNTLLLEIRGTRLGVDAEKPVSVFYKGEVVRAFVVDLLVDGALIVELKAVQMLSTIDEVQVVNYLVATGMNEGLLLNFGGARLEFKKKFRLPKTQPVSF